MTHSEETKSQIQLVRELSNELAAYIYTLSEDVWRTPDVYGSPCEPWKVADVITHLITGAGSYAQSIDRALNGDTSPPIGYQRGSKEEGIEKTIALRTAYDEDLFYEFNASCRRINSTLTSLKPEDYERPVWHPAAVFPISRLIDYRVLELAVHGWDIRYSFDRSAALNEKAIPFLKGWIWRWFRGGFQKSEPIESPIRYHFELDEPVTDSYDVLVTGDDFRLFPSEDKDADVSFHCDTNAYILFCMGRLPFNRSVRRGLLKFEGDEELASQFTEWFGPV